MYQILSIDISEVERNDPLWSDVVKELPNGDSIFVEDILRAENEEEFFVFVDGKRERVRAIKKWWYQHYMTIFYNCEEFGLPHGNGWVNEQVWLIEFLKHMRYTKRLIEYFRVKQNG